MQIPWEWTRRQIALEWGVPPTHTCCVEHAHPCDVSLAIQLMSIEAQVRNER